MQPITSETTLPADALKDGVFTRARKELWAHLPAWMFLIYAQLLLNTELTNISPPRFDLAHTVVFPMAVFMLYQAVRFTSAPPVSRTLLFVSLALSFGLPTVTYFVHTPSPLETPTVLKLYEWSNFAWAALLIAHLWSHGRSHVALFFGVGLLYGAALENGGIVLGFFHETNLTDTMVKPFVAPVATMIGWSVVLSMAVFVTWGLRKRLAWLQKSALLSALFVGTLATFLDLQIDPIATAVGCWVWHESLPAWFHGVPLVNFLAWMCALVPFGYVLFRVQERRRIADGAAWAHADLLRLLAWSPYALLLATLSFIGFTLLLEGRGGPSWELLNGFSSRVLTLVW
jgi:uncharacterized membrane protein